MEFVYGCVYVFNVFGVGNCLSSKTSLASTKDISLQSQKVPSNSLLIELPKMKYKQSFEILSPNLNIVHIDSIDHSTSGVTTDVSTSVAQSSLTHPTSDSNGENFG